MATRQNWLDAGLVILAEHGAPALTIERLTDKLGLTKGSFYHHFKGMPGFRTALLAHFEAEHTARFIDAVERDGPDDPLAKLERLRDLVLLQAQIPGNGQDLEIAMRAWALQDTEVRAAQERVDRTRVDYLSGLWLRISGDRDEAARMGTLLYLVLIGAGHMLPPLTAEQLHGVYDLAIRLAPASRRNP
ncbi:TetR family transcriptional regulator [Herbihabitans rhizosphaerae]|uniref:TetR family transcriptional regulator n=1 Tax=Herbihabitans rhizosphaerae TaxID=1872711 RepID=A0A4Q7KMP1_9PSEU|nr:TetR/AcrR family transcriptional regulator [Herbihabitans rhizosphaerae]RZS37594.1 TetR family transcriptional regulator [Herbihabitans rhizosphaerae]